MEEGDETPDFELSGSNGRGMKLSSFRGTKNIVLCFYPKNHLFGCPSKKVFKAVQNIIQSYHDIVSIDSELFTISVNTIDDQKKFVSEYNIPYVHLSDSKKNVSKVYAGLNLAGLAKRSTFIIDKNGKIRKIFRDIDVENHGKQIVSSLNHLQD